MKPAQLVVIGIAILSLGLSSACGDDAQGTSSTDTLTTQPDSVTPASRKLEFEQAFGDDQAPCRDTARCTIFVSFTEVRSLRVRYTDGGGGTPGQVVNFALEHDDDGVGFVSSPSGVTDGAGIANVDTKGKVAQTGQFVVKAWVDDLPALFFDVVVTPKGHVPLTVVATYAGARPVGSYGVRLYRQADSAPDCSNLLSLFESETPSQLLDDVLLTQSAKFTTFDGLETDVAQNFTVLAYSLNANGTVQAWGCNNTDGVVIWGKSLTVQVALEDRLLSYVGAYNIRTILDLTSAIPEPYRTWVDYVVGFFQSPTTTVLSLACDLLTEDGEDFSGFCGTVLDSNGDLTPAGTTAAGLIDALIQSVAQGSVFESIFQVGGDVTDILKAFELKATLTFNQEPDPTTGVFDPASTNELWHTVVVKWTLGQPCNPLTDDGCGVMQFAMSAFQAEPSTGSFGASIADTWDLTIDQHTLELGYGGLLNYMLEALLIPLLIDDPLVQTYGDMIGYLVGGGSECLMPVGDAPECCELLADRIGNKDDEVDGTIEELVEKGCASLIEKGAPKLREELVDLDTGNAFKIGTLLPCALADVDDDLVVEQLGTQADPCKWNIQIGDSTAFEAKFWGARAE